MKFDMHCHTKEGSLDGKVEIEEYIRILKEKGYQGMLVSDHNSYNGYRYWRDHIKGKKYTDFVVLKGIEYDTNNAGHFLVILPEGVKPRILEMRGMPVELLTKVVHAYGGILGPAHPFGEKYLSFGSSKKYQRNPKIMQEFDFLEAYNSCEVEERNQEAKKAARKYFLAEFGGSDSHKADCIGTAYTEFREPIHTESDLIEQVKRRAPIKAGGTYYHGTTKEKIGKANDLLLYSFWVYNKVAGFAKYNKRRKQRKYLPLSISGGQGEAVCCTHGVYVRQPDRDFWQPGADIYARIRSHPLHRQKTADGSQSDPFDLNMFSVGTSKSVLHKEETEA